MNAKSIQSIVEGSGLRARGSGLWLVCLVAALFVVLTGNPSTATASVVTVDLGTLGGSQSWATAVNASGQVVGYSRITGDDSVHAVLWAVVGARQVLIDGRYYNPNDIVSIQSNGDLRVAIMTTDASSEFGAFDATTVDPSTVTLAGATPADFKYVVRDGAYDLLLQSDLTLQCGTMPVTLEAKTWDGLPLYGEDTLNVVGCQ